MNLVRTGVFATEEEVQKIKDVLNTPCVMVGGYWPSDPNVNPKAMAHKLALKHGLPEIQGYYGCDLQNGEFIKPEPNDEACPMK